MNVYRRMQGAFHAAGVPGFLQYWRPTRQYPKVPEIFATWEMKSDAPALCADDGEMVLQLITAEVHIWGVRDVGDACGALCRALADAGFDVANRSDRMENRPDEWQYHTILRVTILKQDEEDEDDG